MSEHEEKMLIDPLKPSHEVEAAALPPEMLEEVSAVRMMANMLKEEEVEYMFGITAGAEWNMEFAFMRAGVKRVHVRHEATAVFAAEAMGRLQGTKPGFCLIGPSTGITNSSTGVVQAYSAQSPTVIITGEHTTFADDTYAGQGIVQTEYLYSKICKTVKRVTNPMGILYYMKKAFRDALTPPTGPCAIAIPGDISYLGGRPVTATYYANYTPTPNTSCRTTVVRNQADPQLIDKTIKWLLEAERPAMVTGEGIVYDDAEEELKEFVQLLGIPTHCRRGGRGAISEDDPLNCYGRARGKVMRAADRAIVFGLRIAYMENSGLPPFWGATCQHVQMQSCRENVSLTLINTIDEVIGSPKLMLRQMIDCLKDLGVDGPPEKWNDWRKFIVDTKADYWEKALSRQDAMKGKLPLHPDLAGRLTAEFLAEELNNEVITIIDGFTASSFFTDWQKVVKSRYNVDASETIGIGHAPGLALGAGLATGRKVPLFAVMGDGAVGAGGMDIETNVRWDIPCVFMHHNNNNLVTGGWDLFLSKVNTPTGNPLLDGWATLPWIRYDRMFREFGCHTEFVERDEELKPAMKRAFDFVRDQSKPAFIEVFVDPDTLQEIWNVLIGVIGVDVEWDELPEKGQETIKKLNLVSPAFAPLTHPTWWPHIGLA